MIGCASHAVGDPSDLSYIVSNSIVGIEFGCALDNSPSCCSAVERESFVSQRQIQCPFNDMVSKLTFATADTDNTDSS
jgi:hypothetical protein